MDAADAEPPLASSPQKLEFIAWSEAKINPRLPSPVRVAVRAAVRAVKWDDAAQMPRKLALQDAYVRLQKRYRDAPAPAAAAAVPDLVDLETLRCWNSGLTHEAVTYLLARHGGWDAARCVDPANTTVQSKRYQGDDTAGPEALASVPSQNRDADASTADKDAVQSEKAENDGEDPFMPLAQMLTQISTSRVKSEVLHRAWTTKKVKSEVALLEEETGVAIAPRLKQCLGTLVEQTQSRFQTELRALIAKVVAEGATGQGTDTHQCQDGAKRKTLSAADDDGIEEAEETEPQGKRQKGAKQSQD